MRGVEVVNIGVLCSPLSVLLFGCAGMVPEHAPDPDQAVSVRAEMSAKQALIEDEGVAAAPVRVEHDSGTLRLSGFVETQAERERAAAVARRALPDTRVANDLEVWAPERKARPN